MTDRCTWHPILRWLLFLPAGIAGTSLVQGGLRATQWLNGSGAYWGECLAVAAESWAFLAPSLWILPRFHRLFTLIVLVPYLCIQVILTYLAFAQSGLSWGAISEAFIPVLGFVSASFAMVHFYSEYLPDDRAISYSTIQV